MTASLIACSADEHRFCPSCLTLSTQKVEVCPECRLDLTWLASYPDFAAVLLPDIKGRRVALNVQVEWPGGKSVFTREEPGVWELPAGPGGRLRLEHSTPVGPLLIGWPDGREMSLQLPGCGESSGVTVKASLTAATLGDRPPTLSLTEHDQLMSLATEPAAVYVGRQAGRRAGPTCIQLNHSSVSPRHCLFVRDLKQRRYWLADAGSHTGTFVNRKPILAVELCAGDLIQVGPYAWTLNHADGLLVPVSPIAGLSLELQQATVFKSLRHRSEGGRVNDAGEQRPPPQNPGSEEGGATRLGPLNLQFERGTFTAVVGPSGAGKSTLIEALVGAPGALDAGRGVANGKDIGRQRDWFRRRLGYVSQRDAIRTELTARQAVGFSILLRQGKADDRRVEQLLRQVELEGGDWDRPVAELSGGQAKRVGIAAELANEPGLLILDEPGSGLDPDREKAVVRLLRTLAYRGCTVVMVTHNWQRLADVDRVIVLRAGKLAFDGSPQKLRQQIASRDFADLDLERLDSERPVAADDCPAPVSEVRRQWSGLRTARKYAKEAALQFWVLLRREIVILCSPMWRSEARSNPLLGAALGSAISRRRHGSSWQPEIAEPAAPPANDVSQHSRSGWRSRRKPLRPRRPLSSRPKPSTSIGVMRALRRTALPLFWAPLFFASALSVSVKSTDVEGLGFFSVLAVIWMSASLSLTSIVDEREVFDHERLLFLHVVPYVAAKSIPLWILSVLQTCTFAILLATFRGATGWLYGGIWPIAYLGLAGLAAVGMGLLISAVANRRAPAANLILPLAMIAQIVFNVHVAGNGKADLEQAYGDFHVRRCEAAGCRQYASAWLPQEGWRCETHSAMLASSATHNRWAALASYGTISRYADIALCSFAYRKSDCDAFLGNDLDRSHVRRRRKLHEDFGYASWRMAATCSLTAMIFGFPAMGVIVLWIQSGHGHAFSRQSGFVVPVALPARPRVTF